MKKYKKYVKEMLKYYREEFERLTCDAEDIESFRKVYDIIQHLWPVKELLEHV